MVKFNASQAVNSNVVELFTRALQRVYGGSNVDEPNLKKLVNLTQKVYDNGFSKNTKSAEDQYHAGYYLEDLPDSLQNGASRSKSKELYKLYIYNHYSIDPRKVVAFVNDSFNDLKDNVYTYLLIINLLSFTTEWQLPDYMIYQFNQLFNQIEGL